MLHFNRFRSHTLRYTAVPLALTLSLAALSGCGGGGGNNNDPVINPPPTTGASRSLVSGTVSDINGVPIVGATVTYAGITATSTQGGNFVLPNVTVPAGSTYLNGPIKATTTINGRAYSGQNTVEVLSGNPTTPNSHIVVSPTATQGRIVGTIRDSAGRPLAGARVFAGVLTADSNPSNPPYFSNLSSLVAFTDANGTYVLPALPPATYTITGSLAGYVNHTVNGIAVAAGTQPNVSFALNVGSGTTLPVVDNFSATSYTTPVVATRAAGASQMSRGIAAVRDYLEKKSGLSRHHEAQANRITRVKRVTRDTPSGSIIEAVLFWDYKPQDNLFGYTILRSENTNDNFDSIATLRDPLADRFSDVDSILTPDVTYYYSVARLDTILFPSKGTEGEPISPVSVIPLAPLRLNTPASGATTTSKPVLSWTAVNGAARYRLLIYNDFPDYQAEGSADAIAPIYDAQTTTASLTYSGTTLPKGRYYWTVIAQDNSGADQSISPIQNFVVP